jgi:hypothetical protein
MTSSFAQSAEFLAFEQVKNPIPEYRVNSAGTNTLTDPVVSSKTLTAFASMFKEASDARWFEIDNKLMVKFDREGRQTTALYNKNGKHIYTISYGTEKDLPKDVRRLVKINYFDFEITRATEVNTLGKTAWIVSLDDHDRLITLKVVDGDMEETENYRKQK